MPISITPPPADDETECGNCGAYIFAGSLKCPNCGVYLIDPPEPEDEIVRGLFNRHQKTDKGLGGRAEGPDAWAAAVRSFTDAGYLVESASSDWALGPEDRAFQQQLIEGWARAAAASGPRPTTRSIAASSQAIDRC